MARKHGEDRGLFEYPKDSGVWWIEFYHEGKRIRRRIGAKAIARRVYERMRTEVQTGKWVPRKKLSPTVREIVSARVEGFTGRGIKNERHYAEFWTKELEGKRVDEVTSGDLKKLMNRLRDEEKWAPKTINHFFGHLRAALNQALRDGKIDRSSMEGVRLLKIPRGRLRYLTDAEEARLKEVMAPNHFRLVRFAILTGLRREEQFSLRWENIDTRNRVLTIPRSKHGDTRHVPLSDEALSILQSIRTETRLLSPWCFPSQNPLTAMDPQNFYRRVYVPALKAANIRTEEDPDGIVWHTLRHTCASRLVMAGVDIRTVQEIMGHKTLAMTTRYSHLSAKHVSEAINRIANKTEGIGINQHSNWEATDNKLI